MSRMLSTAVVLALLVAFAWSALLLVLLALGCSAAPKPLVTERVVQVPVYQRCATQSPPAMAPIPRPVCDAQVCRWPLHVALDFGLNVKALLEWKQTILTLCAPAPETQPVKGP